MTEFSHLTRSDVATVARMARDLVEAHNRRGESAVFATLAEEYALFELSWQLNKFKREVRRKTAA